MKVIKVCCYIIVINGQLSMMIDAIITYPIRWAIPICISYVAGTIVVCLELKKVP